MTVGRRKLASPVHLPRSLDPSNEAALQRLGEALADDGTEALPGQVEPVLVASPQAAKQMRGNPE